MLQIDKGEYGDAIELSKKIRRMLFLEFLPIQANGWQTDLTLL